MIINRSREYARKGYSTTDSLLYMLQAVYEAVDSAEASTRLFFTDFTKGFDLIDHITDARAGQTRSPSCPPEMDRAGPSWPTGSKQLESEELCRIGELWKEEYPIGTKLGVIVFTVMTNKFLWDWHLRIKFVDDTTPWRLFQGTL